MINQEVTFITDLVATGIEMARLIYRLLYGTWESVVLMSREKFKRKPRKSERTDEEHRGGVVRSSDEISVMEMERRGNIV